MKGYDLVFTGYAPLKFKDECNQGEPTRSRMGTMKCPAKSTAAAWFELRYTSASRFTLARHINPELFDLWFAQPEQ